MKNIDINENCYAHLLDNTVYLYVDNNFHEILYIDNIEYEEDPIPLIIDEMEVSLRPSLFKNLQLYT